jgi:hypothetical protein
MNLPWTEMAKILRQNKQHYTAFGRNLAALDRDLRRAANGGRDWPMPRSCRAGFVEVPEDDEGPEVYDEPRWHAAWYRFGPEEGWTMLTHGRHESLREASEAAGAVGLQPRPAGRRFAGPAAAPAPSRRNVT